jgi:hypothetical protein
MRKLQAGLAIGITLALAVPSVVWAGGKGGGGHVSEIHVTKKVDAATAKTSGSFRHKWLKMGEHGSFEFRATSPSK